MKKDNYILNTLKHSSPPKKEANKEKENIFFKYLMRDKLSNGKFRYYARDNADKDNYVRITGDVFIYDGLHFGVGYSYLLKSYIVSNIESGEIVLRRSDKIKILKSLNLSVRNFVKLLQYDIYKEKWETNKKEMCKRYKLF